MRLKTLQVDFKKFLSWTQPFFKILVVNVLITILLWKYIWPDHNALTHTVFELICIFIAVLTFFVSWQNFRNTTAVNQSLGLGFLVVAIFGILHTYYYYNLGLYPDNYIDLGVRYSILQRATEAIVLYTITLNLVHMKINRWILLVLTLTLSIGLSILLFYYPTIMPGLIVRQEVTKFKILLAYLTIAVLIRTFFRLRSGNFDAPEHITKKYLCTAVVMSIVSNILLTLFESYSSLYLLSGHIFKVSSYFYILKGIFLSSITYPQKQLEAEVEIRRAAEQNLRNSDERFFKAFYASPDSMAITNSKREYLDVNESFLATFGYTREEVIGRKPTDLIIDPEIYQEIGKDGIFHHKELDFHKKNGEPVKILASFERIEIQGEKITISSGKDVTEMVRLKQEMGRLERLKLVGQMSASISHEVRNPLTTVRGFLQMLQAKESDNKRKEYFDIAIGELDKCNSIISEFLSLARDKSMDLKQLNLNQVIESIYPLLLADAAHLGIDIQVKQGNIPHLLLDEKEIRQLILNLTRNGLEAMTSGVLTIRTYLEDSNIVLSVQDQGAGMEPEALEKLGTPFFTTKEGGAGLGLAVCYNIAYRHNAIVDVRTGIDGTTFFVRFNSSENTWDEEFEIQSLISQVV